MIHENVYCTTEYKRAEKNIKRMYTTPKRILYFEDVEFASRASVVSQLCTLFLTPGEENAALHCLERSRWCVIRASPLMKTHDSKQGHVKAEGLRSGLKKDKRHRRRTRPITNALPEGTAVGSKGKQASAVKVSHDVHEAVQYPFYFASRNSCVSAQRAFQWLIYPTSTNEFFREFFEKKPRLFRSVAASRQRFQCLLCVEDVRKLIFSDKRQDSMDCFLKYGRDVDVTKYNILSGRQSFNGKFESLVGEEAWSHYGNGCSLRLLRPQEHFESLWALCSMLETFFESVVGANVYLTPPNSQGFAPHFDDIDAFVCQVSGRKRWTVYGPRDDGFDILPRRSSIDFSASDVAEMSVVVDAVLEPGDMLYLPRGAIHQAQCLQECAESPPSLHVTLSANQQMTWADFLSETVSVAVESAAKECLSLRRTLPVRFSEYLGVGFADNNRDKRKGFDASVKKSLSIVGRKYPLDAAADIMAERFICARLPPWDFRRSSKEDCETLGPESVICATGKGIARVVMDREGELPKVLHCLANSRGALREKSKSMQESCFTCTPEEGFAINAILQAYPDGVHVKDIGLDDAGDRKDLALILLEMGVARSDRVRSQ